jgi:hypothetical protein
MYRGVATSMFYVVCHNYLCLLPQPLSKTFTELHELLEMTQFYDRVNIFTADLLRPSSLFYSLRMTDEVITVLAVKSYFLQT